MQKETYLFQAETKQLLHLMINSVYSNRDIFLRELISNASDALDKRRLEIAAAPDLAEGLAEPCIRISRAESEGRKTLALSDNGIGMNQGELKSYIGTIAKSGAREYLAAMEQKGESLQAEMLIGQFGVGFYSAFMVADRVDVVTRRLGEEEAWRFSSTGDGAYTIEQDERAEAGTTVFLHLKTPDVSRGEKDYSEEWTVREIVKKYSDFITYPILMEVVRNKDEKDEASDERLNSGKAIWRRLEKEVSEEEYAEFYKHSSRDWNDPLTRLVFSVEGGTEFRGLLFIPSKAPFDLMFAPRREGVSLYIRNVFIMNDCKELIPSWLRFLRGVVDSEDLPLNISRELLQEDPLLRVIRKSVVRRVLNALKKLLNENREKYESFWKELGQVVKEGLVSLDGREEENREAILDICLFHTTGGDKMSTLKEYVDALPEGQEHIYYLTGRNLSVLRGSPLLERCADAGYSVLLMADPVDEVVAPTFTEYSGKHFRSLEREDALPKRDAAASSSEVTEGVISFFKEVLGDAVKDVRVSERLTTSPACLVSPDDGGSFAMEQILRSMGQEAPSVKRILEINPHHKVIRSLEHRLSKGEGKETLGEYVFLLYDQCLLAEGGRVEDPALFARRVTAILAENLKDEDGTEER